MTSLNEAMASCVPWQVPGAANYASSPGFSPSDVVCARRWVGPGIAGEFGRSGGEVALGAVGHPDMQERLLSAPASA